MHNNVAINLPVRNPSDLQWQINALLDDSGPQVDMLRQLLDYVDYSFLVVETDGTLVWSNQQGYQAIFERELITLRENRVVPAHESYIEPWQYQLLAAARGDEALLFVNDGRSGLQAISINPVFHAGQAQSSGRAAQVDYLVIILGRSIPCKPLALRQFSRRFRLTPAEQRVVAQLMAGLAPCKVAQANSVAEATIRTQIKSVLAKTGIASIRDLILTLSRLPPLNVAKSKLPASR